MDNVIGATRNFQIQQDLLLKLLMSRSSIITLKGLRKNGSLVKRWIDINQYECEGKVSNAQKNTLST